MSKHLLAIDQGTTGTTALVMDADGRTRGRATQEFEQHFPQPGWVEHEIEDIWQSVLASVRTAIDRAGIGWGAIGAIGITNQRETTLVWERATGRPIHRAIVWQDRRTADRCAELERDGHGTRVRATTGLVLDPYFSATKIEWLLDHVEGARARADRGDLAFGTVDSYLVWRLSGGEEHVTDVTNASRTLLFDLRRLDWSAEMQDLFRVPARLLPRVVASTGIVAYTAGREGIAPGIPIAGIAGDQQAALVGQACFHTGDTKCTYGTGAFVLMNIGRTPTVSRHGLLTTVAWRIGDEVCYALEGSAFVAGAAVQWLRDGLGLIRTAAEIEPLASQVDSSEGAVFVPALAGLGAPYWDPHARGLLCGLTRGTRAPHIARAVLEGIGFEVDDLLRAMAEDAGHPVARLRVDGGAATNDLLMAFQANLSAVMVERPADLESTARGAAMLAGLGCGQYADLEEIARRLPSSRSFAPSMPASEREERRAQWQVAIARSRLAPPLP